MARHKEFEPDTVLTAAMKLFWEQGYDRTSMEQLVQTMGIHKRSMYDTFGDKRELYLKALSQYADRTAESALARADSAAGAREALRALFEWTVTDGSVHSRGCLLVNSATEVAPWDEEIAAQVGKGFEHSRALLLDLVRRGQRAGEIDARHDPAVLADQLCTAWLGLRVQVRAGVDADVLHRTVDGMLALLD